MARVFSFSTTCVRFAVSACVISFLGCSDDEHPGSSSRDGGPGAGGVMSSGGHAAGGRADAGGKGSGGKNVGMGGRLPAGGADAGVDSSADGMVPGSSGAHGSMDSSAGGGARASSDGSGIDGSADAETGMTSGDAGPCPGLCLGPATYSIPLVVTECFEGPTCNAPYTCQVVEHVVLKATLHQEAGSGYVTLDEGVASFGFNFPPSLGIVHSDRNSGSFGFTGTCNLDSSQTNINVSAYCDSGRISAGAFCGEDRTNNGCGQLSHTISVEGDTTVQATEQAATSCTACKGRAVDILHDAANCGGCNVRCAGTCNNGRCIDSWIPLGGLTIGTTTYGGVSLLSIDDTSIYWYGKSNSKVEPVIGKTSLTDDSSSLVATLAANEFSSFAVDASSIYWANLFAGTVMKVSRVGGAPQSLVSGVNHPRFIAVDGTNVYYATDDSTIEKVPSGGGAKTTLVTIQSPTFLTGFAASGGYVFFATYTTSSGNLSRIPIGGGAATTVVPFVGTNFAVDDRYLYWAADGTVMQMPLAGGASRSLVPAGTYPFGSSAVISPGGEDIYISVSSATGLPPMALPREFRVPRDGGPPTVLMIPALGPVIVHGNSLYHDSTRITPR